MVSRRRGQRRLAAEMTARHGLAQDHPHRLAVFLALCVVGSIEAQTDRRLQRYEPAPPPRTDWLVAPVERATGVFRGADDRELVLDNGLIRRTFRLVPNAATVALDDLRTEASLLRGVKPEARVTLDGVPFDVGGLSGQPNLAYLRAEWLDAMTADPRAMRLVGHQHGETIEPFAWRRARHDDDRPWPPPGRSLQLHFRPPPSDDPRVTALARVTVTVHHEMYDGIPVVAKWLSVHNGTDRPVRVDRVTTELLELVEAESIVDSSAELRKPDVTVLSDYSFGGMSVTDANRVARWVPDPDYETQVNYRRDAPLLLVTEPPLGPAVTLGPNETLTTFRVFVVVHDSTERERQGLTVRRAFRRLSPWCTENPIMMHLTDSRPDAVRAAIEQCAAVGFEMVVLSFGSGFDIESEDGAYVRQMKELADHAHEKGIRIGGYSLLSSRSIGPDTDVIDAATGKPGGARFGSAPCLCSAWGQRYFQKLYSFFLATGFDLLEHDGSYPGDTCASTTHPGHAGHADSQWRQWETIAAFYRWCRGRGIHLNVPDHWFLAGSNKIAMGYRETNWSLPRAQQIVHARQNIFDGTWTKTPSMGWMFVPLTQYHGGGAAATIEPLDQHLADYEAHMANTFGLGVQACFRGPRLYDTDRTRQAVAGQVAFFQAHRDILESDLLHLRRADGRDLDYMLHVNPKLARKGLLMVFNPLDREVERTIRVPLYYTGLRDTARVRERDGEPGLYTLDRDYRIELPVRVAAHGYTWFGFE
jgi:hypothetical protein